MGLDIHAAAMGDWVPAFVRINNRMSGTAREPTAAEVGAYRGVLGVNNLRVENLELFVHHVAPGARLRDLEPGATTDVQSLRADLATIVMAARMQSASPDRLHRIYRLLRPFTDGNGRCGRVLWMWQTMRAPRKGIGDSFWHESLDTAPPRPSVAPMRRLM